MTFTKGGLLSTTQLESISGKKWKKGGILSAEQLNELNNSSGNNINYDTVPVFMAHSGPRGCFIYYLALNDNGEIVLASEGAEPHSSSKTMNMVVFKDFEEDR